MTLASCTTTEAPVIDGWKQKKSQSSDYRVHAGDTVYSIAWAFAMDYRDITQLNHLREPYTLNKGQVLHMSAATTQPASKFVSTPQRQPYTLTKSPSQIAGTKFAPTKTVVSGIWLWPTQGKIIRGFSNISGGNKGLDITGKLGQPVVATATGKVVYTGASLPGYGNLIILKHSDNALSAYAFNKVIAVKEGQMVKAGQMIAKMGKNDMNKAVLHFEIREMGKPIDPMLFLQKKEK